MARQATNGLSDRMGHVQFTVLNRDARRIRNRAGDAAAELNRKSLSAQQELRPPNNSM